MSHIWARDTEDNDLCPWARYLSSLNYDGLICQMRIIVISFLQGFVKIKGDDNICKNISKPHDNANFRYNAIVICLLGSGTPAAWL